MRHFYLLLLFFPFLGQAQTYTSSFTGSTSDYDTTGQSGICMMGGATEHDSAMVWFLERANQGDVLVLRTSGSDGYNDYMFNQLGVTLNSVETIVCNSPAASSEAYVQQAVQDAEAIWFAGGDQWNYISYWRNTLIEDYINDGIQNKGLVVGGTSAGMAIQGGYYFSAENGTVTSAQALADPYNIDMTVDNEPFINHSILADVITDTHYDDPDRKGRHLSFLARVAQDDGNFIKGIACNEYTAVCVDENGLAAVYGDYPNYDEFAYFLQYNCDSQSPFPENCQSGQPLDWNGNEEAVRVYKVPGTNSGTNNFNIQFWNVGSGGTWHNWWAENGTFNEAVGSPLSCLGGIEIEQIDSEIYPNPAVNSINFESSIKSYSITNSIGQQIISAENLAGLTSLDITDLPAGLYFVEFTTSSDLTSRSSFIKK
ncbi:MAG: cyanophycinase-like exopeptidase [Arenicella sp.]|jgi:cyanophycinase-like exopeptidase